MNVVGIDIAKGKSMVVFMRPFGEIVVPPYEIHHDAVSLKRLVDRIKEQDGETRVVMEYTSKYYRPVALFLHNHGIYVSVLNALLVHKYGNDTVRKGKTDKIDAIKIANYGIEHWQKLKEFIPEAQERETLQMLNRQLDCYAKTQAAWQNNLLSLLDQTFPGVRALFWCSNKSDGHEKWIDFCGTFWHAECVRKHSAAVFSKRYSKWCEKTGYYYDEAKALEIYTLAKQCVPCVPASSEIEMLLKTAVEQLNHVREAIAKIQAKMDDIAKKLPEYDVALGFYGVGSRLAPQIMAEIGDVSRFYKKGALVAYAGLDSPPDQSGSYDASHRRISKRGSPLLRKALFQAMRVLLIKKPADDPIYVFMQKKRAEGKPYKVYVMAGASKFLRMFYARTMEKLREAERTESVQTPSSCDINADVFTAAFVLPVEG